jgi:hypothetical protein
LPGAKKVPVSKTLTVSGRSARVVVTVSRAPCGRASIGTVDALNEVFEIVSHLFEFVQKVLRVQKRGRRLCALRRSGFLSWSGRFRMSARCMSASASFIARLRKVVWKNAKP